MTSGILGLLTLRGPEEMGVSGIF